MGIDVLKNVLCSVALISSVRSTADLGPLLILGRGRTLELCLSPKDGQSYHSKVKSLKAGAGVKGAVWRLRVF